MLSQTVKGSKGVAAAPTKTPFVLTTHGTSPFMSAWNWNSTTGWGTKLSDPSSLLPSTGQGLMPNQAQDIIFFAHGGSPYVSAYQFSSSGWGTRYSNPATYTGSTAYGVSLTYNEDAVCIAAGSSPYIHAWQWNDSTGFGTKYSNPAQLPPGLQRRCQFRPVSGNQYLATGGSNAPQIMIYPFNSSTGFGTRLGNPSTQPATACYDLRWSYNGAKVGATSSGAPYVWMGTFTGTAWGTPFTAPAVSNRPVGTGNGCAFRENDTAFAVASSSSPYITVYPWSTSTSSFPTKFSNPTNLLSGACYSVEFSSLSYDSGATLFVGANTGVRLYAYRFDLTNGATTLYSNSTFSYQYPRQVRFVEVY